VRVAAISILGLTLLSACQTTSYKATEALAGTSWRAEAPGTDSSVSIPELKFSKKLSPSGMGGVRIGPGAPGIALYQVIDKKLVLRLNGQNQTFDFDVNGDTLTIRHLSPSGESLGTQTFTKE
jgi:hypothetical protein